MTDPGTIHQVVKSSCTCAYIYIYTHNLKIIIWSPHPKHSAYHSDMVSAVESLGLLVCVCVCVLNLLFSLRLYSKPLNLQSKLFLNPESLLTPNPNPQP